MASTQPKTLKRFYTTAAAAERGAHDFAVELDGRPIKTPAGKTLSVPARALAGAIAAEWNAQGEDIVPATLQLTRIANSAIDGVLGREGEVVRDILNYAGTDLVCYRAVSPAGLAAEQPRIWDPILAWVRTRHGAPFSTGTGVQHIAQPAASLEAVRCALVRFDAFKLAALHVMTTLTGSALIALAEAEGFLDAGAAWAAAHVDEAWQTAHWGEDYEAAERQKRRFAEFSNASRFFSLC
ncbi:MAG: ATP12 family protein [Rhodomicrobium sp.]